MKIGIIDARIQNNLNNLNEVVISINLSKNVNFVKILSFSYIRRDLNGFFR